MKKRYLLPIFVVAGFVSIASAEHCMREGSKLYCGYTTGCFKLSNDFSDAGAACTAGSTAKGCEPCTDKISACEQDGTMYTGVDETPLNASPWGTGEDCVALGGTKVGGGGTGEWCRWESSCWPIAVGAREECVADGSVYADVPSSGVGDGKQCEGGRWTGDGKDPNRASRGYCNWGDCVDDPDNQYSCLSGGCFEIGSDSEEADCNDKVASKAQCPAASLPKAERPTPIIPGTSLAGLTVLVNDGSLHISSLKDATVSLFNMQGKQVFSVKVAAGYNVLGLKEQKMGVYYAVVQAGSAKQTVKVLLK